MLAESALEGTITSEYIFFGGMRIARRDPGSGNTYYFLGDRLGNARVVTNSTGGIVEESDFYPFGTERVITDALDNNYKFAGMERDSEAALDHTQYRQYSPALDRWTAPDPVRGNPADPQSFNRYPYVRNSPTNFTDPDGRLIGGISFDGGWGCMYDPWPGEIYDYLATEAPDLLQCPVGFRLAYSQASSVSQLQRIYEVFSPLSGIVEWDYANQYGTLFNVAIDSELYETLLAQGLFQAGADVCAIAPPQWQPFCEGGKMLVTVGLAVAAAISRWVNRSHTVTAKCQIIDFTDGENAIGYVEAQGHGNNWAEAYNDAKRACGAIAAATFPGRDVRVRHCRPVN